MGEASGPSPYMNQQIFNQGLSMETISLYLLCCGLNDAGIPASLQQIQERWNSSEEGLEASLRELLERQILIQTDGEPGDALYWATPPHEWR